MTNPAIEDLYLIVEAALNNGEYDVPIHIYPFRMSNTNMTRHARSSHIGFWRMLKRDYDGFLSRL